MNTFRSVCQEVVGLGGGGAPPAYTAASATFTGNSRITFTGSTVAMSGAGTQFATSFWMRPSQVASTRQIVGARNAAGGALWRLEHSSEAPWLFTNSAVTVVVQGFSVGSILAAGNWYHVLFSFDTTSTSKRWLYVNGVDRIGGGGGWSTYVASSIPALDRDQFYIGNNDGPDSPYAGDMAELWVDDTYIDWSDSTKRDKFALAGKPQDLGSNGSTPFGYAPDVYMRFLSGALAVNSGADAATGTISGTIASGSSTVEY